MAIKKDHNKDKSTGENSTSLLTNNEARWLIDEAPGCIRFIRKQDEKITREDAEDIYSAQLEILSKRGIQDLYSPELRALITLDRYWVSDEERLALLKYHLKERRIPDFFREKTAAKRDYRKVEYIPENKWHQIRQKNRSGDLSHWLRIDELTSLLSRMDKSIRFDEKDIAILSAAVCGQLTKLRRDQIYDVISKERHLFLPADGKSVPDLQYSITKAIGKRATRTVNKIRKFLRDNGDGFSAASA